MRDKVLAFNAEYFDVPVNTEKLFNWFEHHLGRGIIFLSEHGLLTALNVEDPVRDWQAAVETAWYDKGRDGLRLLDALVNASKEAGFNEVRMTTLNTTPPGILKVLERKGFTEIERSHRLLI